MSINDLYPSVEAAYHVLQPIYSSVIQSGCDEIGITVAEFYLLSAFPSFLPNPVDTNILQVRGAYTAPDYSQAQLRSLQSKGHLECRQDQKFWLTDIGSLTIKKIMASVHEVLGQVQPLSVTEMMDLASRLKDCADACLSAPEPPGTWCIQHTRRLDPGSRASIMVRIEHFLTELSSFRDDAHLAAWRSYESNGHAWDILSLLWRQGEMTVEEISAKLKRRGHTLQQTSTAVNLLAKKGWVTSADGKIQISPFGTDIRKIAEETTDRYYSIPFRSFDEKELDETIALLDKFCLSFPEE